MIRTYEIAATKDPSKKFKLECTQEFLDDIKAIYGLDPEEELGRVLQAEADLQYAIQYEGYVPEKVEHKIIEMGDFTAEINPVGDNGLSINVTKKIK